MTIMSTLLGEPTPRNRPVDNLSTMYREGYYGGPLILDARSVGVSVWKSLIDQTQRDGIERGIVISAKGDDILTSKIYKGSGPEEIFDGIETRKRGGSFTPPHFPHGFQSLSPLIKDMTVVHSHPMPPALAHLPTTILNDTDIRSFIASKYHALCAVDRGGAHLLVRTQRPFLNRTPSRDLVKNLIAEAMKSNKGIKDVIVSVAQQLKQYGLAYLYSPLPDSNAESVIEFQEPTLI